MKKILMLATLLASVTSHSQETVDRDIDSKENPQHIERMRDGKVQEFDGDEWMIVKKSAKKAAPKAAPAPAPAPQIVEKTVTVEKTVFVESKTFQKNRVTLLAGEGPRNGVETANYGSYMESRNRMGAIGGLEYQYSFTKNWSAALQVQTNPSGLIGIGYGW